MLSEQYSRAMNKIDERLLNEHGVVYAITFLSLLPTYGVLTMFFVPAIMIDIFVSLGISFGQVFSTFVTIFLTKEAFMSSQMYFLKLQLWWWCIKNHSAVEKMVIDSRGIGRFMTPIYIVFVIQSIIEQEYGNLRSITIARRITEFIFVPMYVLMAFLDCIVSLMVALTMGLCLAVISFALVFAGCCEGPMDLFKVMMAGTINFVRFYWNLPIISRDVLNTVAPNRPAQANNRPAGRAAQQQAQRPQVQVNMVPAVGNQGYQQNQNMANGQAPSAFSSQPGRPAQPGEVLYRSGNKVYRQVQVPG